MPEEIIDHMMRFIRNALASRGATNASPGATNASPGTTNEGVADA